MLMQGANAFEERLLAGHPALDFLNSREPTGCRLGDYESLVRWCVRTGLMDRVEATPLLAAAENAPDQAEAMLDQALRLRQALTGLCLAATAGEAPGRRDLDVLNEVLGMAHGRASLGWEPSGFRLRSTEAVDLSRPVLLLAEAAVGLLTREEGRRLKTCASSACGGWFLDVSPAGRRRWCSMDICGNREKARRSRASRALAAA